MCACQHRDAATVWLGWIDVILEMRPLITIPRLKARCHTRFQLALTVNVVAFSKKLLCLAQTNVITLTTLTHAVHAHWKRVSQLGFNYSINDCRQKVGLLFFPIFCLCSNNRNIKTYFLTIYAVKWYFWWCEKKCLKSDCFKSLFSFFSPLRCQETRYGPFLLTSFFLSAHFFSLQKLATKINSIIASKFTRSQFHQHCMTSFLIRKTLEQLFCT